MPHFNSAKTFSENVSRYEWATQIKELLKANIRFPLFVGRAAINSINRSIERKPIGRGEIRTKPPLSQRNYVKIRRKKPYRKACWTMTTKIITAVLIIFIFIRSQKRPFGHGTGARARKIFTSNIIYTNTETLQRRNL